jgi:hypothetical protein
MLQETERTRIGTLILTERYASPQTPNPLTYIPLPALPNPVAILDGSVPSRADTRNRIRLSTLNVIKKPTLKSTIPARSRSYRGSL